MKLLWVGVLLMTFVWLFALPLYEPVHWAWWGVLGIGFGANIAAVWRCDLAPTPRLYALALVPLVLFASVCEWPHNLGAILLIAALASALVIRRNRHAQRAALGIGISGAILLVHAIVWPFYEHVAARMHSVSVFDPAFVFVVNLLGGNAVSNQQGLFIQTPSGVHQLNTTWEALGSYILLNVAVSGVVLLYWANRVREYVARFLLVLAGYCVLRYILLLFVFASFETADIFWQRGWVILTFLPLPLLLMKLLPLGGPKTVRMPVLGFDRRTAALGGLTTLAVVALTAALTFQDPGQRKQGRVFFDEGHSNWEWMDRPYDTEWYGEQSGYNYYSLGQFLKHYYDVNIGRDALTPELLANYDVLALKTPTSPYSPAEVRAVSDFVKAGGGLWLIGDHTNVFGMGTYLNEIAREFDFAFKFDATYDLATGSLSFYKPTDLSRHPVINRLPFYLFATSCSLDAPMLSEDVIVGYGLKAANADYSQRSFFPKEAHSTSAIEFGLLLQTAAAKFGKGRVLLYTDSTCFSNFFMFMPGKPELALGSIEWLNRRNRYGIVTLVLVFTSLASAAGAVIVGRRWKGFEAGLLVALAVLVGVPAGVLAMNRMNRTWYAAPTPRSAYPVVAFDGEHSRFYLPASEFKSSEEIDLQTFYVWTQRLGLVPRVRSTFLDCLKESDAVVVINPGRPFTETEVTEFVKYVENGGKVLLMDDPRNLAQSTAHQLLRPFDVKIDYQEIARGSVVDAQGSHLWEASHLAMVTGGETILFVKPPIQQTSGAPAPFATPQAGGRVAQPPVAAPGQPSAARAAGPPTTPSVGAQDQKKGVQAPAPGASPDAEGRRVVGRSVEATPNSRSAATDQIAQLRRPEPRFPILSIVRRGNGAFVVLGNSTMFTLQAMGSTGTIPDENRRKLYDLEYRIFRDLLDVATDVQPKNR